MKIGQKEYNFSYTVGASCDREGLLKLTKSKAIVELALIMNKAHEDRKKFYDPEYIPEYLDRDLLLVQDAAILPELDRELSDVFQRDSKVTVETAPAKKKEARAVEG